MQMYEKTPEETTLHPWKRAIGKRLNSLRGISGSKYLESAREKNKLAMRWIG
jgi:hypothetical protein